MDMLLSSGRIRMEKPIYYCLYQLSCWKACGLMTPTYNCRFILAWKLTITHCIVIVSVKRVLLRMTGSKFDVLPFHVLFFIKRNKTQSFLKCEAAMALRPLFLISKDTYFGIWLEFSSGYLIFARFRALSPQQDAIELIRSWLVSLLP